MPAQTTALELDGARQLSTISVSARRVVAVRTARRHAALPALGPVVSAALMANATVQTAGRASTVSVPSARPRALATGNACMVAGPSHRPRRRVNAMMAG